MWPRSCPRRTRPAYRQGVCIWLTGLHNAGKSTTANVLTTLLQEYGRNVTVNSIERANELFAIALAGLIGQNINLLLQRPNLLYEIMQVNHFNQILDETGCGGDYEIARVYLPHLGQAFQTSKGAFTKYKILDLITMFQDHRKVLEVHSMLTQLLLKNGTLNREELIRFFESQNFQEYIEDENLDINFFHRR